MREPKQDRKCEGTMEEKKERSGEGGKNEEVGNN